jgi:hypothetical protein
MKVIRPYLLSIALILWLLSALVQGQTTSASPSGGDPSLTVSVAYVILPGSVTPFPIGAPNFIGSSQVLPNGAYDTGAIWIVNNGSTPVTISSVTALGLSVWGSFTIPGGGSEFLAATAPNNFDRSDMLSAPDLVDINELPHWSGGLHSLDTHSTGKQHHMRLPSQA